MSSTSAISPAPPRSTVRKVSSAIWPIGLALLVVSGVVAISRSVHGSAALGVVWQPFKEPVQIGQTVHAQIELSNRSGHPMTVLGAQTSCGCVVARGLPVEISPGGTAPLTIDMDVGAPDADGLFKQSAVLYNDIDKAGTLLAFQVRVAKPLH